MLKFTTTVALLFGIYQVAQNVIVVTASLVSSVVVDEEPNTIISEVREQLKQAENGSLVDVAVGSTFLSTLVAAVTAAELVDTLNGDGPFTVFGTSLYSLHLHLVVSFLFISHVHIMHFVCCIDYSNHLVNYRYHHHHHHHCSSNK